MSSTSRTPQNPNSNHDPRFWQNLLEPEERRPIGWIPPEPVVRPPRRRFLDLVRAGRHRGRA